MNINQYSPQLIAAVIAFSSVMIGLVWNQIFSWYKQRREKHAKLNYLLFNLLELFYLMSRHDINQFIKIYIEKMEVKLGKIPDNERPMIESMISAQVKTRLSSLSKDEIERLEGNYETAVKQIAEINPFLAYRLAGQSKRINAGSLFNEYLESCKELLPPDNELQIFDILKIQFNEERLLKEAIEDIKDSILEVSKKISLSKTIEAKKFFKRQETIINEELSAEIDEMINLMMSQLQI